MHYLRQETIALLYDKHVNYEKAFNCKKVMEQRSGDRIDVLCTSKKHTVTLVILLGKNNYASYIMTCPALISEKKLDPYNLVKSAFDSQEPRLVNGETRRIYYMGRTNGWIKDFENLFATTESRLMMNSCWALSKR